MTPADRRISELIDRWLASIDLHLQYVELSDAAYARVQPWPKHDRPSRWVLEVARQKILELKQHSETRQAMGDSRFAESLELMAFLANLVGIQNIQRFIPLADPTRPVAGTTPMVEQPKAIEPETAHHQPASADDKTREMPRLMTSAAAKPMAAPTPRPTAPKAAAPSARASKPATAAKSEPGPKPPSAELKNKIIADAIRLLKWGKPWHELAELIGRIADRPPVPEIRKVLRAHKSDIESKAAQTS